MTIKALGNLTSVLYEHERLDDLMARERASLPDDHDEHGTTLVLAGLCHAAMDHPEQAERSPREGARRLVSALGHETPRAGRVLANLADFCVRLGRGPRGRRPPRRRERRGVGRAAPRG